MPGSRPTLVTLGARAVCGRVGLAAGNAGALQVDKAKAPCSSAAQCYDQACGNRFYCRITPSLFTDLDAASCCASLVAIAARLAPAAVKVFLPAARSIARALQQECGFGLMRWRPLPCWTPLWDILAHA